jgi:hypothetical protein
MYKAIEMIPNHVYSILIEDWDEEITGVFVAQGKEWILLVDNQNDFILEGLRFIHKAKLDEVLRDDDEKLKEKVFAKKYSDFSLPKKYDLDDTVKLLQQIKEENKLLHFDTQDEEEIIVGLIEVVYDDKFELKTLTSEAHWGERFCCEFKELSTIAIDNDYLKSLNLLIGSPDN